MTMPAHGWVHLEEQVLTDWRKQRLGNRWSRAQIWKERSDVAVLDMLPLDKFQSQRGRARARERGRAVSLKHHLNCLILEIGQWHNIL